MTSHSISEGFAKRAAVAAVGKLSSLIASVKAIGMGPCVYIPSSCHRSILFSVELSTAIEKRLNKTAGPRIPQLQTKKDGPLPSKVTIPEERRVKPRPDNS